MDTKQTSKIFGEWAYEAIAKHYKKFVKYEKKVLKDKNSHHLHQMRVGMRRLRSTISGFAFAVDLPDNVTPANIGKISKVLGNLRDIDVLQETLVDRYQPYISSEETTIKTIFKKLKKERKLAFKKVRKSLNSKKYRKLKNNCESWINKPVYKPIADINIEQILPDLLLPQISYFLLHPAWLTGLDVKNGSIDFTETNKVLFEDISLTQKKILHDLRKVAKKTRYNMELFTILYGDSYDKYLTEIKEIQEILGAIQDCFVLDKFLKKTLEDNYQQKIPTLHQMLQKRCQQEWQKWQAKQELFLDSYYKQNLRITIIKQL